MERYKLSGVIDKKASVNRYTDTKNGKEVAIKIRRNCELSRLKGVTEPMLLLFLNNKETKKGRSGGRNIVKLIDWFYLDKTASDYALVMEYAQCETLYDYFRDFIYRMSEEDLKSEVYSNSIMIPLFKDICMGVKFIHGLGIAHRDLKLENVLLFRSNRDSRMIAKLADFEFSCQAIPTRGCESLGSPRYAAPEIYRIIYDGESEVLDPLDVDMWALGIILYILSYLEYPFFSKDTGDSGFVVKMLVSIYQDMDFPILFPPCEYVDFTQPALSYLLQKPSQRWTIQRLLCEPWLKYKHYPSGSLSAREYIRNEDIVDNHFNFPPSSSDGEIHSSSSSSSSSNNLRASTVPVVASSSSSSASSSSSSSSSAAASSILHHSAPPPRPFSASSSSSSSQSKKSSRLSRLGRSDRKISKSHQESNLSISSSPSSSSSSSLKESKRSMIRKAFGSFLGN